VLLERSHDNGVNWNTVSTDAVGTPSAYTAPCALSAIEPEAGTLYRWRISAWTSGTVVARIGQ
jgi:hypothetical protein